jgi:hypothetical protein
VRNILRPSYARALYVEALNLRKRLQLIDIELDAERAGIQVVCCGTCALYSNCATHPGRCSLYILMEPMTRENCTGRTTALCPHPDSELAGPDCPCGHWTDAPPKEADDRARQDDQSAAAPQ